MKKFTKHDLKVGSIIVVYNKSLNKSRVVVVLDLDINKDSIILNDNFIIQNTDAARYKKHSHSLRWFILQQGDFEDEKTSFTLIKAII